MQVYSSHGTYEHIQLAKAIKGISLNNISSKKQVLRNSSNLLGILTWMLKGFWFCPLQLQLYNLGSQHLKKSHKQEKSFQQKDLNVESNEVSY